jgi:hypothetical protein
MAGTAFAGQWGVLSRRGPRRGCGWLGAPGVTVGRVSTARLLGMCGNHG